MTIGAYKKIIDRLPQGVFVFDRKLRVRCTNAAFRRSFSETVKPKGTLAQTLGCQETGKCGEGKSCGYCTFYKLMAAAVAEGREQEEVMSTSVARGDRTDKISVRIRVLPVDGKLFLGLTEGSFHSELEREMLSAKRMQQRLLPPGKSLAGVPYRYLYIPSLEVGGDLPDVYELNGQTYGVLSDVSGKGVSASMLSAFVKAAFDRKQPDLDKAFATLSAKFNELDQDERSYITASAVRIDKATGTLRYAIAGHNAPILLKNDMGINEIEAPAPPISNWMPDYCYREHELPFDKGDLLVLITDGVTECANAKGELFGIERTESVLMQSRDAEDFIAKLKTALTVFSGGKFSDDVTAIAFDL